MSDAPAPERRRSSFWLIASLCLNFFLIGVIVTGLIVARNRMAGGVGGGGALPPEVVLQMLPPSGAVKMCGVISGRMNNFRALGRNLVDARRGVFKLFRAEPFDAAAFSASLKKLTAAQVALLQEREATVADVVVRLTPDERSQFTRQVTRRFFSWRTEPRQGAGAIAEICKSLGAGSANLP